MAALLLTCTPSFAAGEPCRARRPAPAINALEGSPPAVRYQFPSSVTIDARSLRLQRCGDDSRRDAAQRCVAACPH